MSTRLTNRSRDRSWNGSFDRSSSRNNSFNSSQGSRSNYRGNNYSSHNDSYNRQSYNRDNRKKKDTSNIQDMNREIRITRTGMKVIKIETGLTTEEHQTNTNITEINTKNRSSSNSLIRT